MSKWKLVADGKSPAFQNQQENKIIIPQDISFLKESCFKSELGIARLVLHKNHQSPVQEMVICLSRKNHLQPHSQNKEKSIFLIEGKLNLVFFNDNQEVETSINLDSKNNFLIRFNGSKLHNVIPITDYVVYHEIIEGPFEIKK